MESLGKLNWSISGGRIPMAFHGTQPAFTSRDQIAILNTGPNDATVYITVLYEDVPPSGLYEIKIKSKRLRKIRFNDLIDPIPVPLEKNFGCVIKSDKPVVVQFSRMDTGNKNLSLMGGMAFPVD